MKAYIQLPEGNSPQSSNGSYELKGGSLKLMSTPFVSISIAEGVNGGDSK